MSYRSFALKCALITLVSAVLMLAMAAGGADKAARYLIAGGALVPRAGAAPHVFTMMTAMILPSVCTFAFSDQLVEDCSRARLTAIRIGSRMNWARRACAGAALRGGFSALLGYGAGLGALLLVGGEEVSGFPGLLASVVLLALQQALLAVVTSMAALRLGEVEASVAVLGVHFATLCALAVSPAKWQALLVPLAPSAQAVLAWHDALGFLPVWSVVYLLLLLLAVCGLASRALSSKELL